MTVQIFDNADEFRIEICGRFADKYVEQASAAWRAALLENTPRRISVDLTQMTSCDRAGLHLLRELNLHGSHIVAGTPQSLVFLNEISRPLPPTVGAKAEITREKKRHTPNQPSTTRPIAAGE